MKASKISIITTALSIVLTTNNSAFAQSWLENLENKWLDERVIFLPKPEFMRGEGYTNYRLYKNMEMEGEKHPEYDKFAGKTARITKIIWDHPLDVPKILFLLHDSTTTFYTFAYKNMLEEVAFLSEIRNARKFIGRSFWNKRNYFKKENEKDGSVRIINLKNLEEVFLVDVRWGENDEKPLKYIFKTEEGDEIFWEGNHSDINSIEKPDKEIFSDNFYFESPKDMHPDWKKKIWELIASESIQMGMTFEMVEMSWGPPAEKYTTRNTSPMYQIWIYTRPLKSYLYFQDGVLKNWSY